MKIAFTADLHLTTRKRNPERYLALEDIFQQSVQQHISTVVIAGDLFDESSQNYSEFDKLCADSKYKSLDILVIPGNHDSRLNQSEVTAGNLKIYSQPVIKNFDKFASLLLPFKAGKTMGEFISAYIADLNDRNWILVGHGDWTGGVSDPNPFEPGVYMPLTRGDLENFKPSEVILGHIHKPLDRGKVHYIGSPCGLDIRETGPRRFLVLDTETGRIKAHKVETQYIFFNESFIIYPVADETKYIKEEIASRIKNWQLAPEEFSKVRVKVSVVGFSSDKRRLMATIKESFRGLKFYKDWEPDLAGVSVAEDINRNEIAERAAKWIDDSNWNKSNNQPDKRDIFYEALKVIYSE